MSSDETIQPEVLTIEEASTRARDPELRRLRASLRTDARLSRDAYGPGFVIESDRVVCLGVSSENRDRTFFAAQLSPISGWTQLRDAEEKLGLASFVHVAPTREAGSELDVNVETVLGLLTQTSLMNIVLFSAPTVLAETVQKERLGFTIMLGFGLSKQRDCQVTNEHGYESHEPLLACTSAMISSVNWPIVKAVIPSVPVSSIENECLRLFSRFSTRYRVNQIVYPRQSCTHIHDAVHHVLYEEVRAFEPTIVSCMARVAYARYAILRRDALVYVTSWIYSDVFTTQLDEESQGSLGDFNDEQETFFPIGTKDSTMQVVAWLNDISQILNSPESFQELVDRCYSL